MYNWSVNTKRLKNNPEKYTIFQLEQAINYGLNGQKLSTKTLKKNLNSLRIDPHKKAFLSALI